MIAPSRILLLLIALAFLPASAGAQSNCCTCSAFGTNCSACCWPDQQANCITFIQGAVTHCGCYCDPVGGGEGGGGGVGCLRLDSQTTVMGADRRSGVEAKAHQLGGGLLNPGERRDGTYNFEEWALVSSEGIILRASRLEFAERVHGSADRYSPREKGGTTSATLVIEDAVHPANNRQIPLPSVAPIDIDADYPAGLAGQEIWFRVEVGKDGVVDQVLLLNVPDDLVAGRFATELHLLNGELGKSIRLRYSDKKRHRVVVFGVLRANLEGHLVMTRFRVLLPKCCCNGSRCA